AESELEHATFWDRALVLAGWARLAALDEAARLAAPLAREQMAALAAEPALAGAPLASVARALDDARAAGDRRDPLRARRALAGALVRDDLRRFRIPCARCGRGTVGVEETREAMAF